MVAVAESGRIPVDNPATHLELTMVHEAMLLEHSGRHLALMEWAAYTRLMIYAVLFLDLFAPWGIATGLAWEEVLRGIVAVGLKLVLLGWLLALAESLMAKMRLFRVPSYLGFAFMLALLGMLSHVILETG